MSLLRRQKEPPAGWRPRRGKISQRHIVRTSLLYHFLRKSQLFTTKTKRNTMEKHKNIRLTRKTAVELISSLLPSSIQGGEVALGVYSADGKRR